MKFVFVKSQSGAMICVYLIKTFSRLVMVYLLKKLENFKEFCKEYAQKIVEAYRFCAGIIA